MMILDPFERCDTLLIQSASQELNDVEAADDDPRIRKYFFDEELICRIHIHRNGLYGTTLLQTVMRGEEVFDWCYPQK